MDTTLPTSTRSLSPGVLMKILEFQTDTSISVRNSYLIASNGDTFAYVSIIDDDHWLYEVRSEQSSIFKNEYDQFEIIGDDHQNFFDVMEALKILVPNSVINHDHLNEIKSRIQGHKSVPEIEI